MDDIRYSELKFLQALATEFITYFNPNDQNQIRAIGLHQVLYSDMVSTLLEDLYIRFERDDLRVLIARLRGELPPEVIHPGVCRRAASAALARHCKTY